VPVRVVVNRMRQTLGWNEHDIVGMVEGYAGPVAVHFLPEDRATVDRALVAGRSLTELGESPLRSGIAAIARAVGVPEAPAVRRRARLRIRRRVV
jgi:hypothetical protein